MTAWCHTLMDQSFDAFILNLYIIILYCTLYCSQLRFSNSFNPWMVSYASIKSSVENRRLDVSDIKTSKSMDTSY